jgi:hypothetical protein
MSDDFLEQIRAEPRPEFADSLYDRISTEPDRDWNVSRLPALLARWRAVAAATAAVLLVATVGTVPAVRAAARDFLELFRVKRFAAISVDPARLEKLHEQGPDLKALIGDAVEVLQAPREPEEVASVEDAAAAAGFHVLTPAYLPKGVGEPKVLVGGEGAFRLTADAHRLRSLLDGLGLSEVGLPDGLHGASVEVHTAESVCLRYARGSEEIVLTEARSPAVSLPPGIDLPALAEIGLRVAGLDAAEARSFARKIDWRSTFVVPVPTGVGEFREVEVRGTTGLLITALRPQKAAADRSKRPDRPHAVLLWSEGDMVYAMSGRSPIETVAMADSLQ